MRAPAPSLQRIVSDVRLGTIARAHALEFVSKRGVVGVGALGEQLVANGVVLSSRVDDARDRLDQIVRDVAEIKLPPRPDALEPLRALVDLIRKFQRRSMLPKNRARVELELDRRSRLVESSSSRVVVARASSRVPLAGTSSVAMNASSGSTSSSLAIARANIDALVRVASRRARAEPRARRRRVARARMSRRRMSRPPASFRRASDADAPTCACSASPRAC